MAALRHGWQRRRRFSHQAGCHLNRGTSLVVSTQWSWTWFASTAGSPAHQKRRLVTVGVVQGEQASVGCHKQRRRFSARCLNSRLHLFLLPVGTKLRSLEHFYTFLFVSYVFRPPIIAEFQQVMSWRGRLEKILLLHHEFSASLPRRLTARILSPPSLSSVLPPPPAKLPLSPLSSSLSALSGPRPPLCRRLQLCTRRNAAC